MSLKKNGLHNYVLTLLRHATGDSNCTFRSKVVPKVIGKSESSTYRYFPVDGSPPNTNDKILKDILKSIYQYASTKGNKMPYSLDVALGRIKGYEYTPPKIIRLDPNGKDRSRFANLYYSSVSKIFNWGKQIFVSEYLGKGDNRNESSQVYYLASHDALLQDIEVKLGISDGRDELEKVVPIAGFNYDRLEKKSEKVPLEKYMRVFHLGYEESLFVFGLKNAQEKESKITNYGLLCMSEVSFTHLCVCIQHDRMNKGSKDLSPEIEFYISPIRRPQHYAMVYGAENRDDVISLISEYYVYNTPSGSQPKKQTHLIAEPDVMFIEKSNYTSDQLGLFNCYHEDFTKVTDSNTSLTMEDLRNFAKDIEGIKKQYFDDMNVKNFTTDSNFEKLISNKIEIINLIFGGN